MVVLFRRCVFLLGVRGSAGSGEPTFASNSCSIMRLGISSSIVTTLVLNRQSVGDAEDGLTVPTLVRSQDTELDKCESSLLERQKCCEKKERNPKTSKKVDKPAFNFIATFKFLAPVLASVI